MALQTPINDRLLSRHGGETHHSRWLQGQVQRELADYRGGELLKEEELRFHALLQELSSSHRTVETLSKALPAGPHAEPARLRWWPFRRPR